MLFDPITVAKVLIDGPSDLIFDYRITDLDGTKPGSRVRVPMRNKETMGTVIAVETLDDEPNYPIKPIIKLLDKTPLITPIMLKMAQWMKEYYGATWSR